MCERRAGRSNIQSPQRILVFFREVEKQVLLKAEVDRELTETERENLAVAETEIYSEFGDDTLVETFVEVVPFGQPLRPLPGGIADLRGGEQAGIR